MTAPAGAQGPAPPGEQPLLAAAPRWYQSAVIYELRVRSFMDSNRDGIGDFPGLTSRLDYLQDLGVTALWLLPVCPSPNLDDGYDIADYTAVHPELGTLDDFRTFLDGAHRRGLRVITELVLNHTSDQHPWFQRARRAAPGSSERDFYVWNDTAERYREARIIFKDFESSNWSFDRVANAYFWHRFYAHQPDLNFRNPAVQEAMLGVVDFWFELGVDGLRLDAVPYLFEAEGTTCENLPETHAFLRTLRSHVDQRFADRLLLAEANQWPEDAASYFGRGDECHMNFHFPIMPRLYMSIHMEDRLPIVDILAQTPAIPEGCQWALFLRNHDELTLEMVTDEERDYMYRAFARDASMRINLGIRRRLAPLCGNDRRLIELMNALLLSLPGTPVIYYGDEIGMGDNVFLGDRNGVRTPMQWSGDRNAGFSRANPQRLILPVVVDPEYHYEAINVETQQENTSSLLWFTKRIVALRKRHTAFGRGELEFLQPDNHRVLAFLRRWHDEVLLVVVNLSRRVEYVALDLAQWVGRRPIEMFGRSRFPAIEASPYVLTLGPHAYYWFELGVSERGAAEAREAAWRPPVVDVEAPWSHVFAGDFQVLLAVLPQWLRSRSWYTGRGIDVAALRVLDVLPLAAGPEAVRVVVVRVESDTGEAQLLALPVALLGAEATEAVRARAPAALIAELRSTGERDGRAALVDALADGPTATGLLAAIHAGVRARGALGELRCGTLPSAAGPALDDAALIGHPQSGKHRRVAVRFGESLLLKLDRFLGEGLTPELELGRRLAARAPSAPVPPLRGYIELAALRGEPVTVATLLEISPAESSAWDHTTDALRRFHERALALRSSFPPEEPPADEGGTLLERAAAADEGTPARLAELIGHFLPAVKHLGTRVGELHVALLDEERDFQPEPFSPLDQRALYQARRNLAARTLRLLRLHGPLLEAEPARVAAQLVARWPAVLQRFQPLLGPRLTALRSRVHGHLHLRNVLYTGKDFRVIDLDGNPDRPLPERRRKRSAIGDLTTLMGSLSACAWASLHDESVVRAADRPLAAPWTRQWVRWVQATLLGAWSTAVRSAALLPASEDELTLLLDVHRLEGVLGEIERHIAADAPRAASALQALDDMLRHPGD